MPVLLEGSCYCKAVKFTVELCQCSVCRKVGGYMGTVDIMANAKTLNIIRGKDKIKVYHAAVSFNEDDSPKEMGDINRSFCTECSTMLWNARDQFPSWIYPFASAIDKPDPLPSIPESTTLIVIMREPSSCPEDVPLPEGATVYETLGPGNGIEDWHKTHGAWVD
ncbi:hypothetical protein IAT38_008343 [Cryptococcus sp. DSM 104549]